ncbi:MAG TPA: MltA domain-containing protein [Verrucomicrobiae bacterium]|nr:MltA domain-containing protein [Verrucomicrobiae bacterium]
MSKARIAQALLLAASLCLARLSYGAPEPPEIKDDLSRESLLSALKQSRTFLDRLPDSRALASRPRKITAGEMKSSLYRLGELLSSSAQPEKLAQAIRSRFDFVSPAPARDAEELLVTGYYLPFVDASLSETPVYRYPVYRRPDDLVGVPPRITGEKIAGPYLSRREIDVLGGLKGKGYEIAWVKDPVDLFFLHIQGSGLIRLEDGRTLQLNYAANNGRPYTSIGKILLDENKLAPEELSAARLRRYLTEHPAEREALFVRNERYIFFRFVEGGPFGSLEVALTPGRSVAADAEYFPRGAPAFLQTRLPIVDGAGNLAGWRPVSRFVVAQDSGAAIRGPGRLDLYFGSGQEAEQSAGFMKTSGRVYILLERKTRP